MPNKHKITAHMAGTPSIDVEEIKVRQLKPLDLVTNHKGAPLQCTQPHTLTPSQQRGCKISLQSLRCTMVTKS